MEAENRDVAPASQGDVLNGKNVLLVVTGGIAAHKAAILARLLVKNGAAVKTVLTEAGARFVTPLTFETLTRGEAAVSMWDRGGIEIEHVSWAAWADLVVVAPATADFLSKLAAGSAGDLASATILAFRGEVLACPAMNSAMFSNPATRANLETLKSRGYVVADSPAGILACGDEGPGRLAEPETILSLCARILSPVKSLRGKKLAITAGATLEAWDSVRFLSNRSSGKMGVSLALAAWTMGAERIDLVAGPGVPPIGPDLPGIVRIPVESAVDMLEKVRASLESEDPPTHLIMAAAPADFRPAEKIGGKIKKAAGPAELPLVPNPDILKTLAPLKRDRVWVGFAAESENLEKNAKAKLKSKNLDFIVANPASGEESAFGKDVSRIMMFNENEELVFESGPAPKFSVAWNILRTMTAGTAGGTGKEGEKA